MGSTLSQQREGDRSGLIGGGLVSACIISRDREGSGRKWETENERGRHSMRGGETGWSHPVGACASIPWRESRRYNIFITCPAPVFYLSTLRYVAFPRGGGNSLVPDSRLDRRLIDRRSGYYVGIPRSLVKFGNRR